MTDLATQINFLPDFYSHEGNIKKIFDVIKNVFQEILDVYQQLTDIDDITKSFGATLDLHGADWGLLRGSFTDAQFQAFILARKFGLFTGNSENDILTYFKFFVNDPLLFRMFEEPGFFLDGTKKLDGTWLLSGSGDRRFRAFDINAAGITIELDKTLRVALDSLKAGGISATINKLRSQSGYGENNYGQGFYGQ